MPSSKDVRQKMEALRDKIRYHEHRYYVLDDPRSAMPNSTAW